MKRIETDDLNSLSHAIIGCAYSVYNALKRGFLEKIYENALAIELRKSNILSEVQKPVNVFYDNQLVGEFHTDILIEGKIILELKSVKDFFDDHFAQCINYLKATQLPLCLLINFGEDKVCVKRFVNPLLNLQIKLS